jgi:hypothetical protein
MLSLSELARIYFCTQPTDMRKSFDSLAATCRPTPSTATTASI